MTQPVVVGVMLTADRPAMTMRAIKSFEAQSYEPKALLILDSGREPLDLQGHYPNCKWRLHRTGSATIGELRNRANQMCVGPHITADIIAHFDSDDWSHHKRLEEQVALLQGDWANGGYESMGKAWPGPSTNPDAVGYNDMLYCVSTECKDCDGGRGNVLPYCPGCGLRYDPSRPVPVKQYEAWWYEHGWHAYALGGSLCYWRAAWERVKFPDKQIGEDSDWLRSGVKCLGVSSLKPGLIIPKHPRPRMVCEIHGANTSSHVLHDNPQWKRVFEWDEYCREKLEHVSLVRNSVS